jgi:uncharacterized membrane protein required for colicin V production
MISLNTIFWIMIGFAGMIGALRGWARELVAMAGLVLALFAIKQFGPQMMSLLGIVPDLTDATSAEIIYRRQFWILTAILGSIAFFSYQGPTLASGMNARLRPRDAVQDKLLGFILGCANGYLFFGTLFSFLEYQMRDGQFVRLGAGQPYIFSPELITRPANVEALTLFSYLPLELFQGALLLPLALVVLFLIIIITLI